MKNSQKNLLEAKYVIVPGKMPWDCSYKKTYNQIYEFWKSTWEKTFAESGSPESYWLDHFIRQDFVVALKTEDEVIGVHLYTQYNMDSQAALDSEYFHYVSSLARSRLLKSNFKRTMSMEYLCANPEWRYNVQNVGVGLLMGAL